MRSDEEIERLIEDWFEQEARPIPHHVLEATLEAVARASQVNARQTTPAWLQSRPVRPIAIAAVVVLVVFAGTFSIGRLSELLSGVGAGPSATAVPKLTWDPGADFRNSPSQMNPSPDRYGHPDVWSYLRSSTAAHEPSTYVLLPDFSAGAWNEPGMVLFVGRRTVQDEGFLELQPWSDGTRRRNAILGWTSPVSGRISIHGTVVRNQRSCSMPTGTVLFSIDRASTSLKTISLVLGQSASFDYTTTIGAGESLYFIVDAGPDAGCDLTYLRGLHILYPPDTYWTLTPI